jgi:hypothetical protein
VDKAVASSILKEYVLLEIKKNNEEAMIYDQE